MGSKSILKRFGANESGQDLVEYSLLIALIAVVCAGLIQSVGGGYQNVWNTATNMLNGATAVASS